MAPKREFDNATLSSESKKKKVSGNKISIHLAAKNGNVEIVRKHLLRGRNPNSRNIYDQTPLSLAVVHNHLEVVQELIKYGANVNLRHCRR